MLRRTLGPQSPAGTGTWRGDAAGNWSESETGVYPRTHYRLKPLIVKGSINHNIDKNPLLLMSV